MSVWLPGKKYSCSRNLVDSPGLQHQVSPLIFISWILLFPSDTFWKTSYMFLHANIDRCNKFTLSCSSSINQTFFQSSNKDNFIIVWRSPVNFVSGKALVTQINIHFNFWFLTTHCVSMILFGEKSSLWLRRFLFCCFFFRFETKSVYQWISFGKIRINWSNDTQQKIC